MCKNVLKLATARMKWFEKAEFNVRLTQVRIAKRQRLWIAQDGKCHYCQCDTTLPRAGSSNNVGKIATLDHIITQEEGGTDHLLNLVVACRNCNQKRGNMDYQTFYTVITTPGAWEEHCKQLAREKAGRDEERRKAGEIRHQAHIAKVRATREQHKAEGLRKHWSHLISVADALNVKYPANDDEFQVWARKFNEQRKTFKQKAGPNGEGLLRAWLQRANFAPRKTGHGWVAVA